MGNHFHLVVETPEANLVAGMRWLLSTFTIRLNHRHKKGSEMINGIFSTVGSPSRSRLWHRMGRCSPMAHRQPLSDPVPGHDRLATQFRRHARFLRIGFATALQFIFRPSGLAQHLSHQPLRSLLVGFLQFLTEMPAALLPPNQLQHLLPKLLRPPPIHSQPLPAVGRFLQILRPTAPTLFAQPLFQFESFAWIGFK
jgi:hypothetical protein